METDRERMLSISIVPKANFSESATTVLSESDMMSQVSDTRFSVSFELVPTVFSKVVSEIFAADENGLPVTLDALDFGEKLHGNFD